MVETRKAYIGLWSHKYTYEAQNCLQVKLYKGKVALSYSQKEVCLVIKKEQEQSINVEHLKDEFCINFGKTDWRIPETIARA